MSQVIQDPNFWMYVKVVGDLGYLCEYISRWSEGCPCHEQHLLLYLSLSPAGKRQIQPPCSCAMRGCRSPQMASGEALELLGTLAHRTRPLITKYLHEATDSAAASQLSRDWEKLRKLNATFGFFSGFPYLVTTTIHDDSFLRKLKLNC